MKLLAEVKNLPILKAKILEETRKNNAKESFQDEAFYLN